MISLLAFLLSGFVMAQTLHLAVLGGGGEPHRSWDGQPNNGTIFDPGLVALGNLNRSHPAIRSTLSFNGGHSHTEQIAQNGFGSFTPFTASEYHRIIEDYKRRIRSGEIKSGDKLLVNLYSHGATRSGRETSHSIAASGSTVTNFDAMTGTTTVSVDALKSLADLAKSKGVKLGIVDLSCHSGNTLALADANTCVISATGPNHYSGAGTMSFGTLFNSELSAGKSLEEAYLAARSRFNDTSFPMISSPSGLNVQDRLYSKMTPYLYYFSPGSNKFTPYMESIATEENICSLDAGLTSLTSEINSILTAGATQGVRSRLNELQLALNEYHRYMSNIKTRMDQFGIGAIGRVYEFCSEGFCQSYNGRELAAGGFEYNATLYERYVKEAKDQESRTMYRRYAAVARLAAAKKQEVLTANPRLSQSAQFWATIPDMQRQTSIMQSRVSAAQRELYLEMYNRSQVTGPNPCRDFRL